MQTSEVGHLSMILFYFSTRSCFNKYFCTGCANRLTRGDQLMRACLDTHLSVTSTSCWKEPSLMLMDISGIYFKMYTLAWANKGPV